MDILSVSLIEIAMRLKTTFATRHGRVADRRVILVRMHTSIGEGVAECVALPEPGYSAETVDSSWSALAADLVPAVIGREFEHPGDIGDVLDLFPGCRMAKAALECALWDAYCRRSGTPLWRALGGVGPRVRAGVAIGIQPSIPSLLHAVETAVQEGYRRVKLKIIPGWDTDPIAAVRRAFPDLELAVDANGAYAEAGVDSLLGLDAFGLSFIEQPLAPADLEGHAALQSKIATAICLDESIDTPQRCREALDRHAARVINIKIGRLGGIGPALAAHDIAERRSVPVWCGGMLETGLGRAYNLAISTLPNFRLPGDVASSSRYFEHDVIVEPLEAKDGWMEAPSGPGSGVSVDWEYVTARTVRRRDWG